MMDIKIINMIDASNMKGISGDYAGAIMEFNNILLFVGRNPGNYSLNTEDISGIFWRRGLCKLHLKKYREAEDDFTIAIRFDKKCSFAYYHRGICQAQKDENTLQKLNDFLTAENLGYSDILGLNSNIGASYSCLNRFVEALPYLNKAIKFWEKSKPSNPKIAYSPEDISVAFYSRAVCRYLLFRIKKKFIIDHKMRSDIKTAYQYNPENIDILWLYGLLNIDTKQSFKSSLNANKLIFQKLVKEYFHKKTNNKPLFFLFMPINENSLAAIKNNYIWCSDPKDFNDPLDAAPLRDYANEMSPRFPAAKQVWDSIRIRSTASYPNADEAAKNTLLWCHYAKEHKGMMIEVEFNKQNLLKHNIGIGAIKYNEIFVINEYDPESVIRACCFTKTTAWQYEREHRLIALASDLGEGNKLPSECFKIKSITFGLKTTQEHKVAVKKIHQNPECAYYEMYQNDEEKKTSPFIVHRRLCE